MQINWQSLLNALGSTITDVSPGVKHPCPLHPGSEPTLDVNVDTENGIPAFRCYHPGCCFNGDAVALVAAVRKLDISSALELLGSGELAHCLTEPLTTAWTDAYLGNINAELRTTSYITLCQQALRQMPDLTRLRIGMLRGSSQFLPPEIGLMCQGDLPRAFREFSRPKYQRGEYVVYPYSLDGQLTHVRVQNLEDKNSPSIPISITNTELGVYPASNLEGDYTDLFITLNPRIATVLHTEFAVESDRRPPIVAAAGFPLPEAAGRMTGIYILNLGDVPLTLGVALKMLAAPTVAVNCPTGPKVFVCSLPSMTAESITSETLQKQLLSTTLWNKLTLPSWVVKEIDNLIERGCTETVCRAIGDAELMPNRRTMLYERAISLKASAQALELIKTVGLAVSGHYKLGNGRSFRRTPEGLNTNKTREEQDEMLSNFDIMVDRKIRTKDGQLTYICIITPANRTVPALTVKLPYDSVQQPGHIKRILTKAYADIHESPYLACYGINGYAWPDILDKLAEDCDVYSEIERLGPDSFGEFNFPNSALRLSAKSVEPQQQLLSIPDGLMTMYGGVIPCTDLEHREPFRRLFSRTDNVYLCGLIAGISHVVHALTLSVHPAASKALHVAHLFMVETETALWQPVFQQLAYLFSGSEYMTRLNAAHPETALDQARALGPLPWIGQLARLPGRKLRQVIDDSQVGIMSVVDSPTARELDGIHDVTFLIPPADFSEATTILDPADLEELRASLSAFLLDMALAIKVDSYYRISNVPACTAYRIICETLGIVPQQQMYDMLKFYYSAIDSGLDDFFQVLHMMYDCQLGIRRKLKVVCDSSVKGALFKGKAKHVMITPDYAIIRKSLVQEINQYGQDKFHLVSLTQSLAERGLLVDGACGLDSESGRYWIVSRNTWEQYIVRAPVILRLVTSAQPATPQKINIA